MLSATIEEKSDKTIENAIEDKKREVSHEGGKQDRLTDILHSSERQAKSDGKANGEGRYTTSTSSAGDIHIFVYMPKPESVVAEKPYDANNPTFDDTTRDWQKGVFKYDNRVREILRGPWKRIENILWYLGRPAEWHCDRRVSYWGKKNW